MEFDVSRFQSLRPGEECFHADLAAILNYYQPAYFSKVVERVVAIEFIVGLDGPAKLETGGTSPLIKVDDRLRYFTKLCCFLVLHELANNNLYWRYGTLQSYESREFQNEVERLWLAGAYKGLL